MALGAYLGATALFETLKLYAFVWPKYILDPAYGSHGDRARGPFVEAIANGMGLFACAVAAGMAMAVWRDRPRVRNACGAVLGLCAAGCLFTLTREVWLGAAIGGLAAMAGFAELRRFVLPAIAVGAAMTVIALATVPGFAGSVHSRTHDDSSLWVRKNVARAAVNMIDAKPLLGFGWNGFVPDSGPYFQAADTYPLKGMGVPVHNLLLRNAVELGLIGTALWLLALVLAVGGGDSLLPRHARAARLAHRDGRARARLPRDHQLRAVLVRVPDRPAVDLGGVAGIAAHAAGARARAAARTARAGQRLAALS